MLKVALLAPIANSLYSRTVAHCVCKEPGMQLTASIVRTPWTFERIRSELRRDGPRLLRKAHRKLILGDQGFDQSDPRTLLNAARTAGLQADSLHALARDAGFRVWTVRDHNDAEALAVLRQDRPDVVVFTGGGLIRNHLLEIPRLGVLNCHMGTLPLYRGMDVVEWPLLDTAGRPAGQAPPIGLTVHFMDTGVDTGQILATEPLPLEPGDSFRSIRERLEAMMPQLMLTALRGLRDGTLRPRPQPQSAGRQFFVMHPRLTRWAAARLAAVSPEATHGPSQRLERPVIRCF